jgi:hypothetical protein
MLINFVSWASIILKLSTSCTLPVNHFFLFQLNASNMLQTFVYHQLLPADFFMVKVKWSRYRPGVAQRVGRGIALLFHDRGTRRRWEVSSTPRPHFTPRKTQYPFYRRLGGPQGRSGRAENLAHRDSIRDRPARSQSLYRMSYPAHTDVYISVISLSLFT